jgi:hypothetical protein
MNRDSIDDIWECGCGAINAGYLLYCGKCGKPNSKPDYKIILKTQYGRK